MRSNLFYSSRIRPRLLLYGLIAASIISVSQAEMGGSSAEGGRFAVICRYYGVSPEEIENEITLVLEEAVADLSGIEELIASSEFSVSRLDLKLSPSTEPDDFLIELRERIDRSYDRISRANPAVQKPVIAASGRDQSPVFSVSFSKHGVSPAALRPFLENEVKPSYSRIPGLGEIIITGGAMPEIHVEVDPMKATASGYSSLDVAAFIQNANIYQVEGYIDEGKLRIPVALEARLKTISKLRQLPIGPGIKLEDIANIDYGYREPEDISRLMGNEGVGLHIKCSAPKLISISRQLREETARWAESGLNATVIYDEGEELENSFRRIAGALATGMLLSGLVLILFGIEKQRVLLLCLGQPVLLFTSLGTLSVLGVSFDHYLLAGIAIGTGMVLDAALLLTEAMKKNGFAGIKKICPALFSSTLSTLLALLPVFPLNREITGLLPLVLALIIMLGLSLILSLIFIPSFYHPASHEQNNRTILLQRIKSFMLKKRRKRKYLPLILSAAVLAGGIISIITTPIKLENLISSPVIFAHLELDEGECLQSVDTKLRDLCYELQQEHGIETVQSTSRRSGGELSVKFDPAKIDREELLILMRKKGREVPGGFLYTPEGLGRNSLKLEIRLTGPDQQTLKKIAETSLSLILKQEWAREGVLHFKEDPPALHYIPDLKTVNNAGLSPADPARLLRWNLQGPVADKWQSELREKDLRVMAVNARSLGINDLSSMTISGKDGSAIRLDQLGSFIRTTEPSRISRFNRQRSVSFTVICRKMDPAGLNRLIWSELDKQALPEGYTFIPSTELIKKQGLYRKLWIFFALTIVLIFFLLSIERESLSQSGLILLQLPLLIALPVITIKIAGLSIGSEIILGLILLIGMGINNGILILDRIPDNNSDLRGIQIAVGERFDSLFLTTVTSITGMIPLLFTNEEFFTGLGIILISGLAGSFIVSIYIFPHIITATNKICFISRTTPLKPKRATKTV